MEDNESQKTKKSDIKIILFIPLSIIIVAIVIMMHWESPFMNYNKPLNAKNNPSAPNFTLPGLDGKMVTLKDYKGRVVLVNIWATWCPPCVAEAPSLENLYQILKDEEFELLAVSIDEDGKKAIEPFMKNNHLTFPVLLNPGGSIMELYGATGVPETFIVTKDGIIDSKVVGSIDWTSPELIEHLRKLIKE